MAQVVKLKRSSVAGKVPTTSNLELGELSINTHDGRVFFEKSSSNGFEIEHILTTNSQTTGSIELVGSLTASSGIITELIDAPNIGPPMALELISRDDIILSPTDDLKIRPGSILTSTFFAEGNVKINSNSAALPKSILDVNGDITSTHITASGNISSSGTIYTNNIESNSNLIITSSNLTLGTNQHITIVPKGNTTPITINHPMSGVGNLRAVVTYDNDEKVLQYNSEKYLLSQSNNLGVYKGVGMATISASIGSAFTQDVADFSTSFVAVHMNYNAVGAQGGYVETGEFHIAYNQSGNSYNHQPKVLLAKNTSQTILNLTSSAACNVSAQINPAFGPVEIMYEFTAFTQGII